MPKGLLIRLVEHAEWVPLTSDPDNPAVTLAQEHVFGLEMEDDERLLDLKFVATPMENTVPSGIGNGAPPIRARLYACQALLVTENITMEELEKRLDDAPPPQPDPHAARKEARKRIHLPNEGRGR